MGMAMMANKNTLVMTLVLDSMHTEASFFPTSTARSGA